jgi:hypothetical protein
MSWLTALDTAKASHHSSLTKRLGVFFQRKVSYPFIPLGEYAVGPRDLPEMNYVTVYDTRKNTCKMSLS